MNIKRVRTTFSLVSCFFSLAFFSSKGMADVSTSWSLVGNLLAKADVIQGPTMREPIEERFLPQEGAENETDLIQGHSAWRWHLLTYPKDSIPSKPYTRAMDWVQEHVAEGDLWKDIPNLELGKDRNDRSEAPIVTGTGSWTLVGPKPIDMSTQLSGYIFGTVIGRFDAIAFDPTTTTPGSIVAFAGSPSGGLWKSTNCCNSSTTWAHAWDNQNMITHAVGAIEIDPNNHNIIYAGTGDFDAADDFSEGIMKSTDGGTTWTQLASTVFTPYAAGTPKWSNQNIGSIKVDPNNSSNVVVGTRFDLFISHDSGANWSRCPFGANPTDPTNAANPTLAINRISSIMIDSSTNPTTAYVAVGYIRVTAGNNFNGDNGVYKGTIPNIGCPALSLKATGWPAGTGNGTNGATNVGRIRLASSRGNGTNNLVIYAQVQDAANLNALGTYVTTNQGTGWTLLPNSVDASYKNCSGTATAENQDWYDLFILADPSNDKNIYVGRTSMYKATVNPGYTDLSCVVCSPPPSVTYFTNLANVYTKTCAGYGTLHPDQHTAVWIPGSTSFLAGGDGGMYVATGAVGGFTQVNSTLNVTQWYAGQTSANIAGAATQYFFGGAQDNGNASWDSSSSNLTWKSRNGGGDGFYTAFDSIAGTLSAGNWFTEYPNGSLYRSTLGANPPLATDWAASLSCQAGQRCAWSTPFKLDNFHCTTSTCSNMVYGMTRPAASIDAGAGWSYAAPTGTDLTKGNPGTVIAVDMAMSNPTTVAMGTDDGNVRWSSNVFGGANCTQALANTATFSCSLTAAASVVWVNITLANAVLPNRAINGVSFDPLNNQKLFAAVGGFNVNTSLTPGHVFQAACAATCNTAANWTWVNKTGNLPDVPAESIVINPNNASQAFVGTDMGFYYTNNITVASPTWYRYQYGLPNTIIKYLTVDRGASGTPLASTTLTAFTYGRGTYAIRLPGSGGFLPHPVPTDMTGIKNGGNVNITYNASCSNVNHNVYWGSIGNYTTITGASCNIGNTGTATNIPVPNGSWWVVTGTDGSSVISSFGKDSTGANEVFSGWNALCASGASQNTSSTCP